MLSPPFPEKVVKRLYLHPKYNVSAKVNEGVKEFYDYDVALIQLEEPLHISILARWELKISRLRIQLTWALIVCLFFHCVKNLKKERKKDRSSNCFLKSYFSGRFAYLAPWRQTLLWNYLLSPPVYNKVMLLSLFNLKEQRRLFWSNWKLWSYTRLQRKPNFCSWLYVCVLLI